MGMPTTIAGQPDVTGPKRRWTYDEMLAALPESTEPMELWEGELRMSPSPKPDHQDIVFSLAQRLKEFVHHRKLGKVYVSPLDVVLTPTQVVQPDVFFISQDNLSIIQDRIRGVPDLIVEVVSAGSLQRDTVEKRALYEKFRVMECWIVDPESRSIEVFSLVRGRYRTISRGQHSEAATSKLLAGFAVKFGELTD